MRLFSKDDLANKLPIESSESGLGDTNLENKLHTANSHKDGSCLKRVRQVHDEQTSVQVIFKLLSRKSKNKLEELLHQWSEWHAQECSLSEGPDEDFESGEETYFPALNVSKDKSCTISFYMDNQVNKKQRTDDSHFNNFKHVVPIYDRDSEFALMSGDEVSNKESGLDILNASRCFNCDAYDHSLKECPKPFSKVVVNNARKLHQLKSKRPAGPRALTRYYQNTPGGKSDGLKPGCLEPEPRKLLGLGEFDPPPWPNRMREMGYPPGYLDLEDEVWPSGIILYEHGDTKEETEKCIDTKSTQPKRTMSISFPGINAPIPVKADKRRWAAYNSKPTIHKYFSNNSALSHRVQISPTLSFRGHSYNPNWQPKCRHEFSSLITDYARSYQNHAPGIPLLSNYANNYLNRNNQPSSRHSYNAYQKSSSSFHG